MAIFQSSVLKKYLKQLDEDKVINAYKKYVKYFHDTTIQQNIRESKEEQYQAKFLDEFEDWNLVRWRGMAKLYAKRKNGVLGIVWGAGSECRLNVGFRNE